MHGHTRASIDAMSNSDKLLIIHHCRTGLIGPMATALAGLRVQSMIHALRNTVLSMVKGARKDFEASKQWPELMSIIEESQPKETKAGLHQKLAGQMTAWYDKNKGA